MIFSFFLEGKIPAVLLNDADAAIAAEVWGYEGRIRYGPAKNIAMITIGTGI
jgi:predicted NBD/HSP70 family sugar kinase